MPSRDTTARACPSTRTAARPGLFSVSILQTARSASLTTSRPAVLLGLRPLEPVARRVLPRMLVAFRTPPCVPSARCRMHILACIAHDMPTVSVATRNTPELTPGPGCVQVEAMQWMWGLWCAGHGGILGDDMGLGKTRTCAAFLAGLKAPRRSPAAAPTRIRRALIIAPTSLLGHWAAELEKGGLDSDSVMIYRGTIPQRAKLRDGMFQGHRIVITTYETAQKDVQELTTCALLRPARIPTRSVINPTQCPVQCHMFCDAGPSTPALRPSTGAVLVS